MNKERIIHIAECIAEELDGARDYLWDAIGCKEECDDIAKTYYDMGVQELEHAKNLCEIGSKLIDSANDLQLQEMWKLSKSMVQNGVMKVKVLQEMYRA